MTGDRFRSAIAQPEEIRIATINDGSVDTVGAAFEKARERMHEIVLDLRVLGVNQPRVAVYDATQGGAPSPGVGTAGPGGAAQATSPKAVRPVKTRLPGGMGIKRSPCKYAGHDPGKGVNVMLYCDKSHVHWKASLQPTGAQFAESLAKVKEASAAKKEK